jgi:hypothetical protein
MIQLFIALNCLEICLYANNVKFIMKPCSFIVKLEVSRFLSLKCFTFSVATFMRNVLASKEGFLIIILI